MVLRNQNKLLVAPKNISIIIPASNEAGAIQRLVDHLKSNSNLKNIKEIIVVINDTSTVFDESTHHVKGTITTHSEARRSSAMNAGAKVSSGDVLYFLHADSYPPNQFDELILSSVANRASAGCFRLRFDDTSLMLRGFAWFTRLPWYWAHYGDQSLYVTREMFDAVGAFKEELKTMEDVDMVKRLKRHTKFRVIKKPILTSARRYQKHGYFRVQSIYVLVVLLYLLGAKQNTITALLSRIKTRNVQQQVI